VSGTSKRTKVYGVRLSALGQACISELAKRKNITESEAHKMALVAGFRELLTDTGVNNLRARLAQQAEKEEKDSGSR
jgi:hypothetical protein